MPPTAFHSFSPASTVYHWFIWLPDEGVFATINRFLLMHEGERTGRDASRSAPVIESQTVNTSEAGGERSYDAGKNRRPRAARHGRYRRGPHFRRTAERSRNGWHRAPARQAVFSEQLVHMTG